MFDLIVTHPFTHPGGSAYVVGDRITDPDLVAAIMVGPNHAKVVRVPASVPSEPAPEPQGGLLARAASAVGFGSDHG